MVIFCNVQKTDYDHLALPKSFKTFDEYLNGVFSFRMNYAQKILACLTLDLKKAEEIFLIATALKQVNSTPSLGASFNPASYPQIPSLDSLNRSLVLGSSKISTRMKQLFSFVDKLLDMGQGSLENGSFKVSHYASAPLMMPIPAHDKPDIPKVMEPCKYPLTFPCVSGHSLRI